MNVTSTRTRRRRTRTRWVVIWNQFLIQQQWREVRVASIVNCLSWQRKYNENNKCSRLTPVKSTGCGCNVHTYKQLTQS